MSCYSPLEGWYAKQPNLETGKKSVVFDASKADLENRVTLPCGHCMGCRKDKAQEVAYRLQHESQAHEHKIFVTLTYDDKNLPLDGSLIKLHIQKFNRALRIRGHEIRYFTVGEYGDNHGRPHYHSIIFGLELTDKKLHSTNYRGDKLYTSEYLTKIWGKGHVIIGDVTFQSIAYVARYSLKKLTGEKAEKKNKDGLSHYQRLNKKTGKIYNILPEFALMSKKPAIGLKFIEKHLSDVYPHDHVIMDGRPHKPPKYYDKQLEKLNPELYQEVKQKRLKFALESKERDLQKDLNSQEKNDRRLIVKRRVKQLNSNRYSRDPDKS